MDKETEKRIKEHIEKKLQKIRKLSKKEKDKKTLELFEEVKKMIPEEEKERRRKIVVEEVEYKGIRDDKNVKETIYKNGEIEINASGYNGRNLNKWRRKNKHTWINIETGEIKEIKQKETKTIEAIRRGMKKVTKLAKNNFFGERNEIFITLTCKENINDYMEIRKMTKSFFEKLKEKNKQLKYLYVLEQQERESWHVHALIKDMSKKVWSIDNEEIERIWGHGYTWTTRIRKDNERQEKGTDGITGVIKYIAKLATKENTPADANLYFASRNIEIPKTEKKIYGDIRQELEDNCVLKEGKAIEVTNGYGRFFNTHVTEIWQKKEDKHNEED